VLPDQMNHAMSQPALLQAPRCVGCLPCPFLSFSSVFAISPAPFSLDRGALGSSVKLPLQCQSNARGVH
jgi:hypothetical protein